MKQEILVFDSTEFFDENIFGRRCLKEKASIGFPFEEGDKHISIALCICEDSKEFYLKFKNSFYIIESVNYFEQLKVGYTALGEYYDTYTTCVVKIKEKLNGSEFISRFILDATKKKFSTSKFDKYTFNKEYAERNNN